MRPPISHLKRKWKGLSLVSVQLPLEWMLQLQAKRKAAATSSTRNGQFYGYQAPLAGEEDEDDKGDDSESSNESESDSSSVEDSDASSSPSDEARSVFICTKKRLTFIMFQF